MKNPFEGGAGMVPLQGEEECTAFSREGFYSQGKTCVLSNPLAEANGFLYHSV